MLVRKKFLIKLFVMSLIFIIFSPIVNAATISAVSNMENAQSVVGYWQTIDGKTKKPSSIIEIKQNGQFYEGSVVKTYSHSNDQKTNRCVGCTGNQKNKPILGLTIIKNMVCKPGSCAHGTILDPRNGKLYHATLKLINNGMQLQVHGYVGIPMFGKTVVWRRVSSKTVQ